jgi:hypothetical protein
LGVSIERDGYTMKYPAPANQTEVLSRFARHSPTPEQTERVYLLKGQFASIAESILGETPPGRAQALACTHLEEAFLYTMQAIIQGEKPDPRKP